MLTKDTHTAIPTARIVTAVRLAVAASVALLLIFGGGDVRRHWQPVALVLSFGSCYAIAVAVNPGWELRGRWTAWLITGLDSVLALLVVTFTGAANSPAVAILLLVVTAAAVRLPLVATVVLALALGLAFVAIARYGDSGTAPEHARAVQGYWWAAYLVFAGVLGAGLSQLVEREHEAGIAARVEAMAEHSAAEEERDLRRRLLASYQSQQDGLAVLLHEFRTPVASLRALARVLADPAGKIAETERAASSVLVAEHANHLSDMLDALADVAASRRPGFGTGRLRTVDLRALIVASADAAGLHPPRLRVRLDGEPTVTADSQRLRRVLTNLLENAARHGDEHPVDVEAEVRGGHLHLRVLDRGPGIALEHLSGLTGKYVSSGSNGGTAGLGLWIVEQIVQALGGHLAFGERDGGGLVARVELPVD